MGFEKLETLKEAPKEEKRSQDANGRGEYDFSGNRRRGKQMLNGKIRVKPEEEFRRRIMTQPTEMSWPGGGNGFLGRRLNRKPAFREGARGGLRGPV